MPDEKEPQVFPLFDPLQDVESFADAGNKFQGKNHRVLTRLPAAREVGEGEIVFSVVGSVKKMHVKLNGIMLSAVLT